MKRNNVYIARFACYRENIDDVEKSLTKLAESIGGLEELDLDNREFKTHSAREFMIFNEKLYELLSEGKIFEITSHCF